jgi:hypothetical protein
MVLAVALAACGRGGSGTLPAACHFTDGPKTVRAALASAPAPVRVDGTPLSKCLVREADPADVQSVGTTFVTVVGDLADIARTAPRSAAATQLGYLEGAVHRGASKTAGIHYELERRVQQELNGIDTRTPQYVRGDRAGESSG